MAFDQSTRNRLQKFVNDARTLLAEEFTRQLQATYGLDPKTGSVAEVNTLTHLDNRQRQTANVLRETLAHYLATTHGKGEMDRTKQALSRIVREQAFTVLNRLAALRMAEARGFLLESIAKGYNSKGFQLYKQLAGSALGETGDAYRNYLYSLFDEFSLDLAVLFDRHSSQGRLFPRESPLLELLDHINHHEIEPLWAEDETIGWIYQYFNSQEERKKMRAESQAPRNSRELAVRNQFFTPRYVVEFLTDNTLGRIWYEMTQGNTRLVDSSRYLVRRPTEVFLKPGEQAPEQSDGNEGESLSQEELLKQPVYIPFRAIKDPRCIRMLDPACGSMHFGLYAFDLFERIYEEAWHLEAELGAEVFVREGDFQPLQTSYGSFDEFKIQIPRLIIEHNIHGVDIDPRAVQIAGLSLWQRAQRAWQAQGIKPQQRPVVKKSNIVCAEPMPGEKALLQEFTNTLDPPVLGQLVEVIFDKMQLAGEAGTLLKIEEEIQSAIHEARNQWHVQSGTHSVGDMFQAELEAATPQQRLSFDLSGIDDEVFWDDAEQLILKSLSEYADQAESNSDQKRLFAEDAAKGFAFIDLCRKRFDVVLMNPPFGEPSKGSANYLKKAYPSSNKDLIAAFVERASRTSSTTGAITSRTPMFLSSYSSWREDNFIDRGKVNIFVDLGMGVLDDAMVETATYITNSTNHHDENSYFIRGTEYEDKEHLILCQVSNISNSTSDDDLFVCYSKNFKKVPNSPFAYWIPPEVRELFEVLDPFEDNETKVRVTNPTADNFRYLRNFWEVSQASFCEKLEFVPYAKGGSGKKFFYDINLVAMWDSRVPTYKGYVGTKHRPDLKPASLEFFFRPGIMWPLRANQLCAQVFPKGTTFSARSQCLFSSEEKLSAYLALMNSSTLDYLFKLMLGRFHYPEFIVGALRHLPKVEMDDVVIRKLSEMAHSAYAISCLDGETDETSSLFLRPLAGHFSGTLSECIDKAGRFGERSFSDLLDIQKEINEYVYELYGFSDATKKIISGEFEKSLGEGKNLIGLHLKNEKELGEELLSWYFGLYFKRWKKVDDSRLTKNKKESWIFSERELSQAFESEEDGAQIIEIVGDGSFLFDFRKKIDQITGNFEDEFERSILLAVGARSLFEYFSNISKFFDSHLSMYSKSSRPAPIYWPLQTPSGSYTLWMYYQRINRQSLYICVNDFVGPKLEQVEWELESLRSKTERNTQDETELTKLADLSDELRNFRDEILQLAKLWKPNLNDGVQITAAPLWKLFQHKVWQKKLKETWEKLEKGDYDWAQLACSIWPERVLRKCHQDRSLAIAHDVEDVFWQEVEVPVKRGKKATGKTKLEWQSKELSEAELNALIQAQIKEIET